MFTEEKALEIEFTLQQFENLRSRIQSRSEELPTLLKVDPNVDLRIRYVNQLNHLLVYFDLNLVYFKQLLHKDFLEKLMPIADQKSYSSILLNYETFNKNCIIMNLFSLTENLFRSILRTLNLPESNQSFWKVKKKIFEVFNKVEIGNGFEIAIDLLNVVRNSVHNNGMYQPTSEKQARIQIVYKNKTYIFSKGHSLFGIDNFTVYWLCEDVFEGICTLYQQPIMREIPLILDPTSFLNM